MRDIARSLIWWLPALMLAVAAGIMPGTFLDSPDTTIPHEAAFVLRLRLITLAFACIGVVLIARLCIHVGSRPAGRQNHSD